MSFFKQKNIFMCFLLASFCCSCSSLVLDTEPFNVLETSHFTFFYRDDGDIAKDLNEIAKYCENGINWFSAYAGFSVELKPDIYLFDEASCSFKGAFADIQIGSHSINGTIVYYYIEPDYLTAAAVILHEVMHVIQDFYFRLDNTALAEGFASFLSLKFYYYYLGVGYSDADIFDSLKIFAREGIAADDGMPEYLLNLSLPDFNRTNIFEADRNPGLRYEIMESFIVYLIKSYGIKSVIHWQNDTTTSNFKEQLYESVGTPFDECQTAWLSEIGYR